MENGPSSPRGTRLIISSMAAVSAALIGLPGASPARAAGPLAVPARARIVPPLRTAGAGIVDRSGRPVRIAGANWYGADSADLVPGGLQWQPVDRIAGQVRQLGLNAVRLQWSNQMLESDPIVPDYAVAANPGLVGRHAMEVFDRVVRALTGQGIMVILDNHSSDAQWCCGGNDGNMLWYNDRYPEPAWIDDWKVMADRYRDDPLVVGVDLRNEPRSPATWGGPPATDWRAAAERGGNAVLSVNPDLLVFVEGVAYAGDLSEAGDLPVELEIAHRVVYEAHDYPWYESHYGSYQDWYRQIYPRWGYLVTGPEPRPLVIGELGTCNTSPTCFDDVAAGSAGLWFRIVSAFLRKHDTGWVYWPLNGTQSTGKTRTWNAPETYGILNPRWDGVASPAPSPAASPAPPAAGASPATAPPGRGARRGRARR